MAAFTSKATGNWSSSGQTTWNEVGIPGEGDTVSIGAHTITVDVNTTVGTSPNDITTKVVDITSGSGILTIGAGVAFTIKGNLGGVNGSKLVLNTGASFIFDPSSSGGTPNYRFINVGFIKFVSNGTPLSRNTVSCPTGYEFFLNANYSELTMGYTDIIRMGAASWTAGSSDSTISGCNFKQCGQQTYTNANSATVNSIFVNNTFVSGAEANSFNLSWNANYTAGVRLCTGNIFDKTFTYNSNNVIFERNFLASSLAGVNGRYYKSFRNNFIHSGPGAAANGQIITSSAERNYFFATGLIGNPHFIESREPVNHVNFSQNIFESAMLDVVDIGDCILVINNPVSGFNITGKNNIVLSNSFPNQDVGAGTMVTMFTNTGTNTEWYRNTVNINNYLSGAAARGAFAYSEGNPPSLSGQIRQLKSNLVWASKTGQGYLGEMVDGNNKNVITYDNAKYNWTWNTSSGNNGRSYHSKTGLVLMWTAGDTAAAGVDNNQGTGNPQFYDSGRNLGKWCFDRGYGINHYTGGLAAIQADLSRIPDLINYIFEGFRPTYSGCRNAAHDSGCVGAANYYKSTRNLSPLNAHRASLSAFGLS